MTVEQPETSLDGRRRAQGAPNRARAWRIPALVEIPLLVAFALAITLGAKATVAQAFSIPSASMEPQLRAGDRVLVSRLSYRLHDVRRGDIVVFRSPAAPPDERSLPVRLLHDVLETVALRTPGDEQLIKRVVGLPGETIEGRDGQVVIDGRLLIEPYLPDGIATGDFGPVTIPEGHVYVLGDNRPNSHDSRFPDIGPVDIDRVVGRAIGRIWPPGRTAFL